MFSTSLVTVFGGLLLAAAPTAPAFQSDYRQALVMAGQQQKPVAVFIGQGAGSAAKRLAEGGVPAEAVQALKSQFICVEIDATTPAGQQLAQSFQMPEGLVISDKTGSVQALRHGGTVPAADLTRYVGQYGGTAPVVRTDLAGTATAPVVQMTAPAAPSPAMTAPVMTNPSYAYPQMAGYAPSYGYPAMSGGCANGRCGGGMVISGGCSGGRCR